MMEEGLVGLEMAAAVAELADTAMHLMERRREHTDEVAQAREQEMAAAEALEQERLQNQRLRSTLAVYQNVLSEFQRCGVLEMIKQLDGLDPNQFQERLKQKLESQEFHEKIHKLSVVKDGEALLSLPSSPKGCPIEELAAKGNDLCHQRLDAEEPEDYIVVSQDDVYDGIACFVARHLSTMPKTKDMSPQELQEAMSKAFVPTKKNIFIWFWRYSKILYTAASWTSTVVGIYQNPLIIRSTLMAIWTTTCILLHFLK